MVTTVQAQPPAQQTRLSTSEADVDITMTGGGETVSYTAALELDEAGNAAAALTLSASGVTLTYDANDISDITTAGADGEDDNQADIKVSYAGGGLYSFIRCRP